MIDPASLIGFGLTLVVAAWLGSAVLCGAVLLAGRWLGRLGPAAERAAASAALVLGPTLGVTLVAALAGHSLVAGWSGGGDHCPQHGHHPHLCLVHGGDWADQPWAIALLAMVCAFLAVSLVQKAAAWLQARRALRRIERLARPAGDGVLVAPARTRFCFVAGVLRPRIFVSSAAWDALDPDERRAAVAHERAHLAGGDLGRRAVLGLAALLGAPLLARRVLVVWNGATERLCDARAARVVEPAVVAAALLVMSRGPVGAPAGISFGSRIDLVARIEALLGSRPTGERAARRLRHGAGWLLLASAACVIALADPLHHVIETFLGVP